MEGGTLSNSESGKEVDVVIFTRGCKILYDIMNKCIRRKGDTPIIDTNCRRRVIMGHVEMIHVVVPWVLR